MQDPATVREMKVDLAIRGVKSETLTILNILMKASSLAKGIVRYLKGRYLRIT